MSAKACSNRIFKKGFTPLKILKNKLFAGQNNRSKFLTGFTLLEVIFAVGIITVVLISVLGLFRYVIFAGRISLDRFVASNLAQEGIELVRSMRDSNWLAGQIWNQGIGSDGDYYVQYDDNSLHLCSGTCPKLYLDSDGYYNNDDDGIETKFTRKITITRMTAGECGVTDVAGEDECVSVSSEVSWQALGGDLTTTVEDRLYNWK